MGGGVSAWIKTRGWGMGDASFKYVGALVRAGCKVSCDLPGYVEVLVVRPTSACRRRTRVRVV